MTEEEFWIKMRKTSFGITGFWNLHPYRPVLNSTEFKVEGHNVMINGGIFSRLELVKKRIGYQIRLIRIYDEGLLSNKQEEVKTIPIRRYFFNTKKMWKYYYSLSRLYGMEVIYSGSRF